MAIDRSMCEVLKRELPDVVNRRKVSRLLGDGVISNWARRRIWAWPYRHMRRIDSSIHFEQCDDGGWDVLYRGERVLKALALSEWGKALSRDVLLVASGPSAREHEWGDLDGRSVVAVNGSPSLLRKEGVKVDYWVVSDPVFNTEGTKYFKENPELPLVLTHQGLVNMLMQDSALLKNRPVALIERVNQWYGVASKERAELMRINREFGSPFVFPEGDNRKMKVGWSRQPELGFFSGCTVVYAALQVLIGLGTRNIDIVGMDLGGNGRCYDEGKEAMPSTLSIELDSVILPAFKLMSSALEGEGVSIRNLSPVSPLQGELVKG